VDVSNDILSAKKWYKKQQDGLQHRFAREVLQTIKNIQKDPLIYQIKYENTRVAYLNIFPFGVHYYIDESRYLIIIIAVMHQHRNPEIYHNR